jgi:hypothetical protein
VLDNEGKRYVAPWSTAARCWAALDDFKYTLPADVIKFFVPQAIEDSTRSTTEIVEDKVSHALTSTWHIPPRWFALFHPEERLRGENEDGPFTIMRTSLGKAKQRTRSALQLEGEILEIRAVNSRIGYGQRRIRSNQVAIVSGGTKHGIGLRAAATPTGIRSKLVSVALGVLEALGDARSPFVYKGKALNFVDTPHMSVSMILLPKNHDLKVGQYLKAQVRFTTTNPDWVLTK